MLPLAPPLEQEDKGVQVDLQDLGYETSGKSEAEVDREESSSTGRRPCLSVEWTLIITVVEWRLLHEE